MSTTEDTRPTPPYTGFGTLSNLFDRMEQEGVPDRLDRFYLSNMAGGTRQQVTAALRSLGLLDEDNHTVPELSEYVENKDKRPEIMARLLRTRFPEVVELSAKGNATQGQLLELLSGYGIQGETARKAATFMIAAMTFANLPVSPHFAAVRPSTAGGGTRRGTRKGKRQDVAPKKVEQGTAPDEDMKKQYFDLLVEKARGTDEPDDDLLDRIERLIGVAPQD